MPSEAFEYLIEALRSMPQHPPDVTIQELRGDMEESTPPFELPEGTRAEPVDADGVPAELIVTAGADENRTLLYVHGGGYVMGSVATHRALVTRLSSASGARCLSLDYRLAPEHPFPAAVLDSVKAYRWLLGEGAKPGRLAIAGDSAGGGLTIATLVALRDDGVSLPACAVALSPWVDLEGTGDSTVSRADMDPMITDLSIVRRMADAYLNGESPRTPLASPLYADLAGLAPLLIQVGDAEVLLDDSTRIAERAKAAGVETELEVWEDMIHGFQSFADMLPEAQQAIDKIGRFLKTHWE